MALIRPWLGFGVRHIPDRPFDVYDFSRAGLATDNRWNMPGEPTLYLARDRDVALAEWARHLDVDRAAALAPLTRRRKVYRFEIVLEQVLDLCDPALWQALSLTDAPEIFLDKAVARATAQFIRRTTPAVAIFTPSVAFLDRLDQWVLAIFLEKLQGSVREVLPADANDEYFTLST